MFEDDVDDEDDNNDDVDDNSGKQAIINRQV